MDSKNGISSYLQNFSLFILGAFILLFPLVFTTITTEPFFIPKQILLAVITGILLILFSGKTISEGVVKLRRTPFDVPLILFTFFVFLSSLLAVNRFDSLFNFALLFFVVLDYFIIVNIVKEDSSLAFIIFPFIGSAVLVSIFAIFSYFKIYILPFPFTHNQFFTPLGSLLDQSVYLFFNLFLASSFLIGKMEGKTIIRKAAEGFSSFIILAGLLISLYGFISPSGQKLLVLPFETGFRTAFAAISQDQGRTATSFLLGSGFGTYATDFTRFKDPAFNLNQDLWSLTFIRSSSFILELLATTGILGFISYLFLVSKILRDNNLTKELTSDPLFLIVSIFAVLSLILPLDFTLQTVLLVFLGLFAAKEGLKNNDDKYYDMQFHFAALKNGIISAQNTAEGKPSKILPVTFFILNIALVAAIGFYAGRFTASDVIFQSSLVAASANNGLETYNNQVNAIKLFPYKDSYYRIYSQTNLTLANSLIAQLPKGTAPSADLERTVSTLIQQAITSGRQATEVAPQTSSNWQNLSSAYRSLIGFGQNAESFAVIAASQSQALDPVNPSEYINLGGIYYQLNYFDEAAAEFQKAINLKPDLANAYYNLGHALESKNDLQNALLQYQKVKSLVVGDKAGLSKITAEIDALQKKLGRNPETTEAKTPIPSGNQPPLGISTPSAQLPEQEKKLEIEAPQK